MTLVLTDNVQILAKAQSTADLMLCAKQLITDQSASVLKATKDHPQAKAVLRLDVEPVQSVLVISGVIRASVKILALILVHVVKMHNVAFCTTKHFVLVLVDLWVTHVKSVFLMSMNVLLILVGPTQDVSI